MFKSLKITSLAFVILIMNLPCTGHTKTMWAVIRTEKEVVVSFEVEKYIDNVLINDSLQSSLFKSSGQNFNTYLTNKDLIIENTFGETLKRMSFIRLAQQIAIKQQSRQFFVMTKKEFEQIVNQKIKNAHNLQTKKGLSADQSNDGIVEDLKTNGFPYNQSETNSEIYARWLKRIEFQTRENIREKEALKFICTLGDCRQNSPVKILLAQKKSLNSVFIYINPSADISLKGESAFQFIADNKFNIVTNEKVDNKLTNIKHYYFIGRLINEKYEFVLVNDHDFLTGSQLQHLGYPNTDDFGRTSGIMFNYKANGSEGSLALELETWLFSKQIDPSDIHRQYVEEQSTVRIVSRKFLDDEGKTWIIIGAAANLRQVQPGFHSFLQKVVHSIDKTSTPRTDISRDGQDISVEGIFGLGGKYSILKNDRIDISIKGEGLLTPNIGMFERSRISVNASLDVDVYGKNKDSPVFFASLFSNHSLLANGTIESLTGGKIGFGKVLKNVYLQASFFVMKWDEDLDRKYENGVSWTTGLSLSATFINHKPKVEFEFN